LLQQVRAGFMDKDAQDKVSELDAWAASHAMARAKGP